MKQYRIFLPFPAIVLLLVCWLTSIPAVVKAQYNFTQVDNWLSDNSSKLGGRVILVIYKDGRLLHTQSVNSMNLRQKMMNNMVARRQGKTADTDDYTTISRQMIASCSKWLSAALIMTFVDEGKLALTDTVGRFLPVLSQHGKGNITISQCLSHLTAIRSPDLKESLQDMKTISSMDEAIDLIAAMPMEGIPGKVFRYSNTGLQIAGAVIEKISGKSFETLFAERIARPLEMTNTDFGKGKVALPAGGASSTPDDYIHFLAMILNKGIYNGKRILSETGIRAMQENRISKDVTIAYSPAEAGNLGYGFGEWVMGKAVTSPGLFGSFPWVDNEKKYCAFMMAFYLKSEGRNERYVALKKLVDEALH